MKKLFTSLAVLLIFVHLCVPALAAGDTRLQDGAHLLTAEEAQTLCAELDRVSAALDFDILVTTTQSLNGLDVADYAEQYHQNGDFRPDAVLLVIAMNERRWDISCYGAGETAFDASAREYIGERLQDNMTDGDFDTVFADFAALSEKFVRQARAGEPYGRGNLPKKPLPGYALPVAAVIGALIGGITVACLYAQLKSVRRMTGAADYICPGSMQVTQKHDLFLYRTVDRREKPQANSSGGSHSGGSGGNHTSGSF